MDRRGFFRSIVAAGFAAKISFAKAAPKRALTPLYGEYKLYVSRSWDKNFGCATLRRDEWRELDETIVRQASRRVARMVELQVTRR